MDLLFFKVGEIPPGGVSIEITGGGQFPEWSKGINRLEIHTVIGGTEWQDELLSVIHEPELSFPHGFEAVVSLERKNDNIIINGRIVTVVRRACSRCTELFDKKLDISFRSVFSHESVTGKDIELKAEDFDLNFFHGDMFDVGQVITEQISLNLSIKPLCDDDCPGLCVRCGKNLNEGMCACKDDSVDVRFEKLKNFQIK